jgi:hypothetical protein
LSGVHSLISFIVREINAGQCRIVETRPTDNKVYKTRADAEKELRSFANLTNSRLCISEPRHAAALFRDKRSTIEARHTGGS